MLIDQSNVPCSEQRSYKAQPQIQVTDSSNVTNGGHKVSIEFGSIKVSFRNRVRSTNTQICVCERVSFRKTP